MANTSNINVDRIDTKQVVFDSEKETETEKGQSKPGDGSSTTQRFSPPENKISISQGIKDNKKKSILSECGLDNRCICMRYLMNPASDDSSESCEAETVDSNASLDARLIAVTSPLSIAERRVPKMLPIKLYKNRVERLWHKRYNWVLPPDQQFDFQPYEEIQRRDEEIAVEYYYGENPPSWITAEDGEAQELRNYLLEQYNKEKRKEEEAKAAIVQEVIHTRVESIISVNRTRAQDTSSVFGPSARDKAIMTPLINFMDKLRQKKNREKERQLRPLPIHSKWHKVKSRKFLDKINMVVEAERKVRARNKFRKTIKIVWAVMRFIRVISSMSRDARLVLSEIKYFQQHQRELTQKKIDTNKHVATRSVFDPKKYTMSSRFKISNEIRMILTKSWYARTDEEVKTVVDRLQELRCFVEYPVSFQHKLARLAWLIEVAADLAIIREGHIAADFYFMLAGKAKMITLHGSPCLTERGTFHTLRIINNGDAFGDESMSHPDSERPYSVITLEQSALLSLSSVDYITMLLNTRMDEVAPEHIIFLSTLEFLRDFPKTKLIEEGDEYIRNYYLRAGSVISEDLSESDYIYVVKYGSCRVLVEIPPAESYTRQNRRAKTETHILKKDFPSKELQAELIPKQNCMRKSSVMEFISSQMDEISKYPNGLAILRNEKSLYPENDVPYEKVEAEMYCKKARKIFKSLRSNTILTSSDPLLKSASKVWVGARGKASSTDTVSQTESEKVAKSRTSVQDATLWEDNLVSQAESNSQTDTGRTSRSSKANLGDKILSFDVDEAVQQRASMSISRSVVGAIGLGIDLDLERPSAKSSLYLDRSLTSVAESNKRKDSEPNINLVSRAQSKQDFSGKAKLPEIPPLPTKKNGLKHQYSKWKLVRTMVKGDFIGQEWVNLNRGPFVPPVEEMSLVSDGCEVIMMHREFLIKYLRKEL